MSLDLLNNVPGKDIGEKTRNVSLMNWKRSDTPVGELIRKGEAATGPEDVLGTPPKDSPTPTDYAVRKRKMAQALQLMAGRSRKQSFIGGSYDTSALGGGSVLGGG